MKEGGARQERMWQPAKEMLESISKKKDRRLEY
jgi:hypothetical protein